MKTHYQLVKDPVEGAFQVGESGYIIECEDTKRDSALLFALSNMFVMPFKFTVTCKPHDSEEEDTVLEFNLPISLSPENFILDDDGKCAGIYSIKRFFPREKISKEPFEFEDVLEYDWGTVKIAQTMEFECPIGTMEDIDKLVDKSCKK